MLAIFDQQASNIKMPLLPRHLQPRQRDPSRQAILEDRDRFPTLSVLEHFCAWTGQVERRMSSSALILNSSPWVNRPD